MTAAEATPSRHDLEALADGVIEAHHRGDTPFGLYVLPSRHAGAELARSVEREVFYEFFGNTPELLAEEYGPYEQASVYFCVLDHRRRQPVGVMRVIVPSEAGHKSVHDLERVWGLDLPEVMARTGLEIDTDSLWDVATMAVRRDYRGDATNGLISMALFQTLGMLGDREQVKSVISVLDLVVLDLIQTNVGRPLTMLDGVEPRRYLDSPSSLPGVLDAADYKARLRFGHPDLFQLVFEGKGLETLVSGPRWELGIATDDENSAAAS